ncbi:MAG: DoxX family membrane protein [Propionibacteriaceae bacterium]|nr:DoxX family membrane protein [Propionibacteriaceae bacterium]
MSSHDAGDWVRQGTPRGADWEDDQSEYGTALEPAEWDDYATEQAVPVERPQPRPRPATRAAPVVPAKPENGAARSGQSAPSPSAAAEAPQQPDHATEPTLRVELEPGEPPAEEDLETTRVRIFDEAPRPPASSEPSAAPERPAPQRPAATHESRPPQAPPAAAAGQRPATPPVPQRPVAEEAPQPAASGRQEPQPQEAEPRVPDAPVQGETRPARQQQAPTTDPVLAQRMEATPEPEIRPKASAPQRSAQPLTPQPAPAASPVAEPSSAEEPAAAASPVAPPGLYRPETPAREATPHEAVTEEAGEVTSVQPHVAAATSTPAPVPTPPPAEEVEEERRLQEQLAAERAARNERLGVVKTSSANESRTPPTPEKRSTDRPLASFGLFFLRVVTAAILGIIAYQGLTNIDGTAAVLERTLLPQPRLLAWIGGFTLISLALLLVVGLLQRVVGVVLLLLSVVSLVFIRWGQFSPFVPGVEGFMGDRDLLLGAVGLLLICVGGGGWGIDAAFRHSRQAKKAEQEA